MRKGLHILALLLAMSIPALSFADAVRMSIQPNGKGSFFLTGENVIGVQALDVDIDYDSSQLENPYVMINGGDLKQVKADSPGKLFLSVFRPIADPLLQIILNFDTRSDADGGIYHISAITRSTARWPAEPDADASPSPGGAEDEPADGPADASSKTRAGETAQENLAPKVNPAVVPDRNKGGDAPSAPTGPASSPGADKKVHTDEMTVLTREAKSVLQRFKQFKGEKSLNSFVGLFWRSDGDRFVQEPAIAISDGKTPVTIRMEVEREGMHPVGIALSDARLISKETGEKGIVITVLPSEGTWDARLVIVAGQEILDYPLVVAPPVNLARGINAHNFLDAMQAYINNQSPVLQREDNMYISEYIFTANYLAGRDRMKRSFVSQY
jgi:hypothetical protein